MAIVFLQNWNNNNEWSCPIINLLKNNILQGVSFLLLCFVTTTYRVKNNLRFFHWISNCGVLCLFHFWDIHTKTFLRVITMQEAFFYYCYYRRHRNIFWVGDPILKKHDEILQILRFLFLKIPESRDAGPLQFWCPWLLLYFDDRHSHSWNSVIWYDKEKKIFYWSVQFTCQTARRQIDFIILCKYIWFLL